MRRGSLRLKRANQTAYAAIKQMIGGDASMAFTMERWHSAVGQRFSVRKYKGEPGEKELKEIKRQADALSAHNVRIVLGYDQKVFVSVLGSRKIKGTGCFAAFVSKNAQPRSVGYLGEAFILECTAMGFGTCWLGMYNKKAAAAALQLQEEEQLTCITPIGMGTGVYAARPRKPLSKLTGLDQEELQNLPEWQRFALECARMAPSAVNGQPWKFTIEGQNIRIQPTGNNLGYAKIDCGIAMLHMELGAAHGGVAGEWETQGGDALFKPTSFEN